MSNQAKLIFNDIAGKFKLSPTYIDVKKDGGKVLNAVPKSSNDDVTPVEMSVFEGVAKAAKTKIKLFRKKLEGEVSVDTMEADQDGESSKEIYLVFLDGIRVEDKKAKAGYVEKSITIAINDKMFGKWFKAAKRLKTSNNLSIVKVVGYRMVSGLGVENVMGKFAKKPKQMIDAFKDAVGKKFPIYHWKETDQVEIKNSEMGLEKEAPKTVDTSNVMGKISAFLTKVELAASGGNFGGGAKGYAKLFATVTSYTTALQQTEEGQDFLEDVGARMEVIADKVVDGVRGIMMPEVETFNSLKFDLPTFAEIIKEFKKLPAVYNKNLPLIQYIEKKGDNKELGQLIQNAVAPMRAVTTTLKALGKNEAGLNKLISGADQLNDEERDTLREEAEDVLAELESLCGDLTKGTSQLQDSLEELDLIKELNHQ